MVEKKKAIQKFANEDMRRQIVEKRLDGALKDFEAFNLLQNKSRKF